MNGADDPKEEDASEPQPLVGSHAPDAPAPIATLPPDALEDDGEALVLAWAAMLDRVDYLALLQLPADRPIEESELRQGFHRFALAFHPDRWREAHDDVRSAAIAVYCLGAEAYKVLQDPLLRKRYLRLRAAGKLRMPPDEIAQSARAEGGESFEAMVRSPQAIPFAKRADELMLAGNVRQAKLQVQLALAKDPGNARLEERLADLAEVVKALGPASRKPG